MSCIINPSSSYERTLADLKQNGVIDENGTVLDPKKLIELNRTYSQNAKERFNLDGNLFISKGNTIQFNVQMFHYIDGFKGLFYPENEYVRPYVSEYKPSSVRGIKPETEGRPDILPSTFSYSQTEIKEELTGTLMEFLKKVNPNFRVEVVDDLNDGNGISLNGILKLNEALIELKRGQESAITEEVAHVYVELLDKESQLFKDMMSEVTRTKMYKLVLEQYGEHPMYKGKTEKLKREAAAKLVSLYLSDKKLFEYMTGSPTLISTFRKIVQKLLNFIKAKKVQAPFKDAAMRILAKNTDNLDYRRASESEYMYQMANTDMNYISTAMVNTTDADVVYVNINDALLNVATYTPKKQVDKDNKEIPAFKIKRGMWFSKDQTALNHFYENAKLTNLGIELKDKWSTIGRKVVFFTNTPITQALRDRLNSEFESGTEIEIVNITPSNTKVEGFTETGAPVFMFEKDSEKEILVNKIDGRKAIVIESKRNDLFVKKEPNITMALFNDKIYQQSERAKNKISRYRTIKEIQEEQARAQKSKEFTEQTLAEFQKLGQGQILQLSQKALKIVKNLINRIENNESEADLIEMFKDENGNLVLPLDKAKRILRQIEDRGSEFEEGLLSFVNTMASVTAFWKNANINGNYAKLTEYTNKEELNKNLKEVATLMRFALNWEEYIKSLTTLLEDNTFGDMKVIPGMISNLRSEVANAKAQIAKVSVKLLSDVLSDQADNYNAALKLRYAKGAISEQDLKKNLVTPERLADIMTGKYGDLAATAYFENGLFVGDDLIQTFNIYIDKTTTVANQKSFLEFMDVNAGLQKLLDELGTTDDKIHQDITYKDSQVYYEYPEGSEENVEARPIQKIREVVSFLNPFKNEYRYEEEFEKVLSAKHAYQQQKNKDADQSLSAESAETKLLREEYEKRLSDFKVWEKANWNRENVTEPDEVYAKFGLDMNLIKRANVAQMEIREEIRSLQSQLRMGHLPLAQQKDISEQIEEKFKELKDLRNPWDRKNNRMKTESNTASEDIRIANILKEKHIIDRQLFEYNVDNEGFVKDLRSIVSTLSPEDGAVLSALIDVNNPNWLSDFYEEAYNFGNSTLIDFLDQNTKVKYSDDFYETRGEIIEQINRNVNLLQEFLSDEELGEIKGITKDLDSQFELLKNISSSLRDEDGVFNAIDTTPEHQKLVKEIDANISSLREAIREYASEPTIEEKTEMGADTEEGKKLRKKYVKIDKIKSDITLSMAELMSIQTKFPTDAYNTSIYELLKPIYDIGGGVYPNEDFIQLITSPAFEEWKNGLEQKDEKTEDEQKFLDWFNNNHIVKKVGKPILNPETGTMDQRVDFAPTYIWMKIEPKNKNHVQIVPSYKYTKREYKKNAAVDYKGRKENFTLKNEKIDGVTWNPITKRWLPLRKDEYINQAYYNLQRTSPKKFEYLKKLSDYYIAKQMQPDVPKEGKLGYIIPFVHKRYTEGNALNTLLKQAQGMINPVEEGNVNRSKGDLKVKPNIFKRALNAIKAWSGLETEEQQTETVRTDFLGNKIQKFNVKFTGYLDPENVSKHSLASVFSYVEGLETTRALVGKAKESNLLLQILEQHQPFEKNTVNQAGERIPMKTNRRLDLIRDVVQRELYGNYNEYELGEWAENATRTLRNYTVGMSQSIINPSNSVKNWLQGQITNITLGGYKNWASEASIGKAMASKNTSYVKYMMDMKQPVKSLDFQILTLFNLTNETNLSDKASYSGYRKQLGIDNLFYASSTASEFSVVSTLLYAHLYHKDITINGESKKLYDVFHLVDNKLAIKDGSVDPETGKTIDMDYLASLTVKAKVMAEHIANKQGNKAFAERFTLYKNLIFFKSFLPSAIRTRFAAKRRNIAMGEDIEGFYRVGLRYLIKQAMSLTEHSKLNMIAATPEEKEAARIMMKELAISIAVLLLIGFVFGFDDDDEDRYKKLKDNNWITNFALLTLLNTKKETDAFSIYPLLNVNNNLTPPIITETWSYITDPFIGFSAIDRSKKILNALSSYPFESGTYKQNMPQYFIEKGDTKLGHALRTLVGIDAMLYIANPELKIQQTQQAAARG